MRTKRGQGAKVHRGREKIQKDLVDMDSPDMSSIEKASFMEGLQRDDGNPLHSTAMEEDLKVSERGNENKGKAKRGDVTQTPKPGVKKHGGALERKEEEKGETKKRTGVNVKAKPEKKRQMKDTKKKIETENTEEDSDSGTVQKRSRRDLSSDNEELEDEDISWKPIPKKPRLPSVSQTKDSLSHVPKSRKSSSGSASGAPGTPNVDKQKKKKKKKHGGQGGTQLEVVLDAFTDFCDQFRESVESKAIKQSIDSLSYNVKEQLYEKISSEEELKVVKRENAKVGSLIRTKTQRLYDAKHELMRAERQIGLLQKEKAKLKQRLSDLRRGQAFLHDIGELNRQYLEHRQTHPKENETYGASSLPALLLETRHIQMMEHQLRGINHRLEKKLDNQ